MRCRGIHGHSYRVEVCVKGEPSLDDGMVADFKRLKEIMGPIIDAFDHSLILRRGDPLVCQAEAMVIALDDLNPRYIIVPYEPTAEMMAAHFAWTWRKSVNVQSVRVHETETGYAEFLKKDFDALWYECVPFGEAVLSAAVVEGLEKGWGVDNRTIPGCCA